MISDQLFYENKQRTRVCGLCFKNESILLVKHNLNGKTFYAPPGGGVEFGELMEETLKRELNEETGINMVSAKFQFITEYVKPPLHAVEVFYHVESWKGTLSKGNDPESELEIIQGAAYYTAEQLMRIKRSELHHIFHNCTNPIDLLKMLGYIQPIK